MKTNIPTYSLYGEASEAVPDFWIHTESIPERSSRFNWEIKQHRHECFLQILQIRSGTGDAWIEGENHRLSVGTLVFVPEQTAHGFRFSRDVDGQIITALTSRLPVQFQGAQRLRAFVTKPRVLDLGDGDAEARYLLATLDLIQEELAKGFGARNGLVDAYLQVALTLAAGHGSSDTSEDAAAGRDFARIARLNALIGKHFREHLPVDFYAREINVSVTHLNRITKAQTGRTMNELLSDKIVSQAKRDLVFTFMTAQEIAYGLGFADPAYFTRFFSREAGETPRQFREKERNRQMAREP